MSNIDLSHVSTDDLLAALRGRNDVVISAWRIEDITPLIEDEGFNHDLSTDEIKEAAFIVLNEEASRLTGALGERGNDYLAAIWQYAGQTVINDIVADRAPSAQL